MPVFSHLFLVTSIEHGRGFADIIINEQMEPVGLITAEIVPDSSERIKWNVDYAVSRIYRHKGFALNSLIDYIRALREYSINSVYLDISVDNGTSEAVVKKIRLLVARPMQVL